MNALKRILFVCCATPVVLCAADYSSETAPRAVRFANPPASARILPIHHGRPNGFQRVDTELAGLIDNGFGGLVANVDFNDYLDSKDAWATFRYLTEQVRAKGLSLWLYDEKGYPSCTAGGKTLEGHPEWRARAYLVAVTNVPVGCTAVPPSPPGKPVATLRRLSANQKTQTVFVVTDDYIREGTHISASVSRFKYDYPNLLMREPTARFIELTHEAYRRELGADLLKSITSTFTDEPSLMTFWMRPMPYLCLPVSDELLAAYAARAGHPLVDDVPELVQGDAKGAVAAVRHRFWSMVGERVSENYASQLTAWATKNGTLSGGHLLAEESLIAHPLLYGDFFKTLRQLSAPSCDMLQSIPANVTWLTPLLVGSAGELNGARRVMSEASDHCQKWRREGDKTPVYQVSVREIVGSLNRQIWGGVNTFTSYYRWNPFSREEKRAINDEIGRTVTLMSEGRTAADIALLYPADTLMTGVEPKYRGAGGAQAVRTARAVHVAGEALFCGNRSFLFVDTASLEAAEIRGDTLVCGSLVWRTVILPGVTTVPRAVAEKLAAFVRAGGLVIAVGDRPCNSTTAFPDADVTRLAATFACLPDAQANTLADFIASRHAPALVQTNGKKQIIRTAHRRTAEGDVFFVFNDSRDAWEGAVRLTGDPAAQVWDPRRGVSVPVSGEISLALPPYGGVLITTTVPVDGARVTEVVCPSELDQDARAAVASLRARANQRIAEIRATPNRPVPAGAACYYVSEKTGDDAADGRTPQTAWKTSTRLNAEELEPGAYVLFARGGVYRGTVKVRPGVTYTAYGEGPKPCIYGSPENGADPAKWTQTENPRVWAYDIGRRDVGTLVFDDGAVTATKIVIRTDRKTGKTFNKFTGRPFNSYRDLDGDLHFWHDYYEKGTGKLYLYSEQNPGTRFRSIEFNVKCHGFAVGGANDVTIGNFTVKYVGVHGVGAGTCRNLTIGDCEFAWIGGSIQAEGIFGRDYPTRLGNAVEIYGACDGYSVTNCYIWQVYDAGVTHQRSLPKNAGMMRSDQKNVRYADNVFEKCNYSIEYFLTAWNDNPSRMENILFENNLMFDAGYGFCEQRPDRNEAAHIKAWYHGNRNRAKGYVIRNNAFCYSQDMIVQICSGLKNLDGSSSLPAMTNNVFVGRAGDTFGNISDSSNSRLKYGPDTESFVNGFGAGNRCLHP